MINLDKIHHLETKHYIMLAGGLFFVIFLIGALTLIEPEKKEQNSPFFQGKEQDIPQDFFSTLPKKKEVEILPPPVIEEEPQPKPKLNPRDLFLALSAPEDKPSEVDLLRQQINAKRGERNPFKEIQIKEFGHFKMPQHKSAIKIFEDPNSDKDFSEHEEPRTTATYPVDLERVITMDRMIPAVMITEVRTNLNSEKVLAQVESDVVGSHGRKILIPAGSRIIGRYAATGDVGDTRVMIEWYRIITPAGINIKLKGEVADQEGAAGLTGRIDNRWKDRYGAAMLFATVSSVAQMTVPADNENAKAAADAFSDNLGEVTAEAIRRGFDIAPVVRIPKGARVYLSPLEDIWFKEPKPQETETEATPIKL